MSTVNEGTTPTSPGTPLAQTRIVKQRYPGRWIAAIIIAIIGLRFLWSIITNEHFGWHVVGQYLLHMSILHGLAITIFLTIIGMAIGIVLGVIFAVMRLSDNPVVKSAASAYIFFFRATPLLVQLIFWYNLSALYPIITLSIPGLHLNANELVTPMVGAILGLGLNEGSYMSEIVRSGIMSISTGQHEAASALGMRRLRVMFRIVIPQAMRVIIPPTGNEVIGMLKNTSLVSVMAVPELLYSSELIYSRNFQTIPLLIVASIWYMVATAILSSGQYYIERYYARGNVELPETPLQMIRRRLFSRV